MDAAPENQAEAERELLDYRRTQEERDDLVRRAHAAGLNKRRIHLLSGIARSTIHRIITTEQ